MCVENKMLKVLAIGVLVVVAGGGLIWILVQSLGKEECKLFTLLLGKNWRISIRAREKTR